MGAPFGKKNPRWNNGKSEYPNHTLMKKQREERFRLTKGKCEICGKNANEIHHIDYTKTNHNLSNIISVCCTCHKIFHRTTKGKKRKKYISAYVKKYGLTVFEIANLLNCYFSTVYWWEKNGKLKSKLENISIKQPKNILLGK